MTRQSAFRWTIFCTVFDGTGSQRLGKTHDTGAKPLGGEPPRCGAPCNSQRSTRTRHGPLATAEYQMGNQGSQAQLTRSLDAGNAGVQSIKERIRKQGRIL